MFKPYQGSDYQLQPGSSQSPFNLNLSPEKWTEVFYELKSNQILRDSTLKNHATLLLPLKKFTQLNILPPPFRLLVFTYGSQNCLKALSRIFDLSFVQNNKYKFMFEGFTLGKAVRLLIQESVYFIHNLKKKQRTLSKFQDIIICWIESIFQIHKVEVGAQVPLKTVILESVELIFRTQKMQMHVS